MHYVLCFIGFVCTDSFLANIIFFFFFNDTATTEIYTLSLHDALPICGGCKSWNPCGCPLMIAPADRKSTRLNSSHMSISYAVFCLKKKKREDTMNLHWYRKRMGLIASSDR